MNNHPGPDQQGRPPADVRAQRVARVYAEALLNEAQARNQAADVRDELEALVKDVVRASPEAEAFFVSAAIGRDRKARAIRSALGGQAGELVLNFLLVLNAHDRLDVLDAVATSYRELLEQRSGQIRAYVRSAVPLDDDQKQRIEQEVRTVFEREPLLHTQVDPELLGGFVLRVGDWLYDASVRARLGLIRKQLMERSNYEIQSGRDRFSSSA